MKRANANNLISLVLFLAVAIGGMSLGGHVSSATTSSDRDNITEALCSASFAAPTSFIANNAPMSVAKGDFNGDGKLDLVTAHQLSNNVAILLGTGTGSFGTAVNFSAGFGTVSVAVGDFNSDGKIDVVTANEFGANVSILLGTGTGSFGAPTTYSLGSRPRWVAVGDLNSDGKLDVVTANGDDDSVVILLGTGAGSLGVATHFPAGSAAGSRPFAVTVADLNGDQKPDLAVANTSSANVSILLGTGTGSFGAPTNFAVGSNPRFIAIADFNGG